MLFEFYQDCSDLFAVPKTLLHLKIKALWFGGRCKFELSKIGFPVLNVRIATFEELVLKFALGEHFQRNKLWSKAKTRYTLLHQIKFVKLR